VGTLRSHLRKLRELSWAERGLVVEAALVVTLVSAAIRLLPFRHLMRLAEWPLGRRASAIPRARLPNRVRWALQVIGRRAPDAVCLHQSLTAQILLRRRGAPSILYYGAHPGDAAGMRAHAWVVCDGYDVVGGEAAHDFAVLATFPRHDPDRLKPAAGT
jgi:hypothetical protein